MIEGLLSPWHLFILLVIGILVFGKRLPEMGRSLGKGIVEFKKGLRGLEDEMEAQGTPRQEPGSMTAIQPPPRPPQRIVPAAPKFEETPGTTTTPPQA